MIEKVQLDAAHQLLGMNSNFSLQVRSNSLMIQRWKWDCGCQIDGIERGENIRETTFRWQRCDAHLDVNVLA